MNRIAFFLAGFFLLAVTPSFGQEIRVTPIDTVAFEGQAHQARIDFVSSVANLKITESNGETVEAPRQREDSMYVYTCICNVRNTNRFKFSIAVPRAEARVIQDISIEEHQLITCNVDVEIHAKLGEIKVVHDRKISEAGENISRITLTTDYNKLTVLSNTGEEVKGPQLDANGVVIYTIDFDLTTKESRAVKRGLQISADGVNFKAYDLGTLFPPFGKEIAVIVVRSSCYLFNVEQAEKYFSEGNYKEAGRIYKKLTQTDECDDKPSDLSKERNRLRTMATIFKSREKAVEYWKKAEQCELLGKIDSFYHYHGEAYKERNLILKYNETDNYCLTYNKLYIDKMQEYRIVSGRLFYSNKLDMQGNPLPLGGWDILMTTHERIEERQGGINGRVVIKPGKLIRGEDGETFKRVGQSAADGRFTVTIPPNKPAAGKEKGIMYVLWFSESAKTDGSWWRRHFQDMIERTYGGVGDADVSYVPKETHQEAGLVLKIHVK
jgi:hypothetical protein